MMIEDNDDDDDDDDDDDSDEYSGVDDYRDAFVFYHFINPGREHTNSDDVSDDDTDADDDDDDDDESDDDDDEDDLLFLDAATRPEPRANHRL